MTVFGRIFKRPRDSGRQEEFVDHWAAQAAGLQDKGVQALSKFQTAIAALIETVKSDSNISLSDGIGKDIVFIDGAVEDIGQILRELDPETEVHVLDLQTDGIEQISDLLTGRQGLVALHLFAHGSETKLNIGAGRLSSETISADHAKPLTRIARTMQENGSILIYGCDFGAGENGRKVVDQLAEFTGIEVVVSAQVSKPDNPKSTDKDQAPAIENPSIDEPSHSNDEGELDFFFYKDAAKWSGLPEFSATPGSAVVLIEEKNASFNRSKEPHQQTKKQDLTIISNSKSANGTVTFDLADRLTYVPDPGYQGVDSFTFDVSCGGDVETAVVNVIIAPLDNREQRERPNRVSTFIARGNGVSTIVSTDGTMQLNEGELAENADGVLEFNPSEALYSNKIGFVSLISVTLCSKGRSGAPSLRLAVSTDEDVAYGSTSGHVEETESEEERWRAHLQPPSSDTVVASASGFFQGASDDLTSHSLWFAFDEQLAEKTFREGVYVGQLTIDTYLRNDQMFIDINNSFDPATQGLVTGYRLEQVDGSPSPDWVLRVRDGFFCIEQQPELHDVKLKLTAELENKSTVSRYFQVDLKSGEIQPLVPEHKTVEEKLSNPPNPLAHSA